MHHESGSLVVTVDKTKLLKKLKQNREVHKENYKNAHEGWVLTMKDLSAVLNKEASDGRISEDTIGDLLRDRTPPSDHTDEYSRAIDMMEMSEDLNISMDQFTFDQYVRDNWTWKETWSMSNTKYVTRSQQG